MHFISKTYILILSLINQFRHNILCPSNPMQCKYSFEVNFSHPHFGLTVRAAHF